MSEKTNPKENAEMPAAEKSSIFERCRKMHAGFWTLDSVNDKSPRGRLVALYRVVFLTIKGVLQNKLPMQSAALTYYSLMSLAPIVGLALIISGFILRGEDNQGQRELKAAIVNVIHEVIPQTGFDDEMPADLAAGAGNCAVGDCAPPVADSAQDDTPETEKLSDISDVLDKGIDRLLNNAANGKAGVVGIVILSVLVVLMIAKVEDVFNTIWSIQFGRSWKDRFINYLFFTIIAFLLGAASLTMLSAGSLARALDPAQLEQWLGIDISEVWGGPFLLSLFKSSAPTIASICFLTCLTGLLNKYMPSTRVHWGAAFAGGLVAAVIIVGNQKLGALYVSNVVNLKNLYGELSIVLIVMFGMYLTWLFLLIGGQFSYALQNVRFLADHRSWESLSVRAKQTICFAALLVIARRFKNENPAPTAEELGCTLNVPTNILNEALAGLAAADFISRVVDDAHKHDVIRYRPAKPLDLITVASFKETMETKIGFLNTDLMAEADPSLPNFAKALRQYAELPDARVTLDAMISKTK